MPRTRSLAWAELKFGLIAVFALVMAALLIFAVGGGAGFFWQNYPLKVQFPNVAGLMLDVTVVVLFRVPVVRTLTFTKPMLPP